MKKKTIIALSCAAVLIAAGIVCGVCLHAALTDAARTQAAVNLDYQRRLAAAGDTTLTVTEQGRTVGVYHLSELGLLDDAEAVIRGGFSEQDRLSPEEFAALPMAQRRRYADASHPTPWQPERTALEAEPVLRDLNAAPRQAAVDASVYFEAAAYRIAPEQPGSELDLPVVRQALADCLAGLVLETEPVELLLEIGDGCYLQPAVTEAENDFDYAALLAEDLAGVTLSVSYYGGSDELAAADYVTVDERGALAVREDALSAYLSAAAEAQQARQVLYRLDSYVSGPTEVPLLGTCSYDLDVGFLEQALRTQLLTLQPGQIEAQYRCTNSAGEPYDPLGDTYIEVDIHNQTMTYFEAGEVVVSTPVVTGYPWGHLTPSRLCRVQTKATDCWLSGEDFHVFVKYWMGLFDAYGIHDASWRDEFGGEIYQTNGSHGCVNTPDDPMKLIYERAPIGTPVLLYDAVR